MLDAVVLLGPLCVVEVVERAHQVSGDAADALKPTPLPFLPQCWFRSVPPQTSSAPSGTQHQRAEQGADEEDHCNGHVHQRCASCSGPFDDPSDDIALLVSTRVGDHPQLRSGGGLMLGVRSVRGWSRVRSNATCSCHMLSSPPCTNSCRVFGSARRRGALYLDVIQALRGLRKAFPPS